MATADSTGAGTAPTLNIEHEVSTMRRMTNDQLRAKYLEVFREPTRSRHKEYLIKRIAWRLQANAEGGLSERALRRAAELANEADIRVTPPRERKQAPDAAERSKNVATNVRASKDLLPGTVVKREYKGQTVIVNVLSDGFEYEGQRYGSLSAVAKAVTGSHWNGYHFFNLRKNGGGR